MMTLPNDSHNPILRMLDSVGELLGYGKLEDAKALLATIDPGGDAAMQALRLRLLGAIALREGDSHRAIELLERGVAEEPADSRSELATALRDLANAYDETGEHQIAESRRQSAEDRLAERLAGSPDWAIKMASEISKDLRRLGHQHPNRPLHKLVDPARTLKRQLAVSVLVRLAHEFALAGEPDKMAELASEALDRVHALDEANRATTMPALLEAIAVVQPFRKTEFIAGFLATIDTFFDGLSPDEQFVYLLQRAQHAEQTKAKDTQAHFERVLDHAAQKLPENKNALLQAKAELGAFLAGEGKKDEAEDILQEALDTADQAPPALIGKIASELGYLADASRQWERAADMHGIALTQHSEAYGDWNATTYSSRYEVAEISRVLGRDAEAELHYRNTIEVGTEIDPDNRILGAKPQNNLGDLLTLIGRADEGRALIEEALEHRIATSGTDSKQAWRSRHSLAHWHLLHGDPQDALDLIDRALTLPDLKWEGAWWLLQGAALCRLGDFETAETICAKVFERIPADAVDEHISRNGYIDLALDLAISSANQENWLGAVETLATAAQAVVNWDTELIQRGATRQTVQHVRKCHQMLSVWIGAALKLDATERSSKAHLERAGALLQSIKGLRTRHIRLRQPGTLDVVDFAGPARRKRDEETRARLRNLETELVELELQGTQPNDDRYIKLRASIESTERQLSRQIPVWSVDSYRFVRLGADDIGLEILRIDGIGLPERSIPYLTQDRYVGLLIEGQSKDSEAKLIDFGLADPIDTAVKDMRASLVNEGWIEGARKPGWWRLSKFLGRKLIGAVEAELAKAKRLFIAPDGILCALPFELLRVSDDRYLDDAVQISYLACLSDSGIFRRLLPPGEPPLVLGGPDYDLDGAYAGARTLLLPLEQSVSRGLGDFRFAALPQAEAECRAVAAQLDTTPFCDRLALSTLVRDAPSPEILHIATHGFCVPQGTSQDHLASPLGNELDQRMVLSDPMQRSGLALAGANAALDKRPIPVEAGTGFLYAAQIQGLNLQRTDLVFLAACRSGLGELEVGDGAQGLGRAFMAAGCRSVVMALWDIPETASRNLVERFYKELDQGKDRIDALSIARRAMREKHPNDPIYWAGLILMGDPNPLNRHSSVAGLYVANLSLTEWKNHESSADTATEEDGEPDLPDWSDRPGGRVLKAVRGQDDLKLTVDERMKARARTADIVSRLGDYAAAIATYEDLANDPSLSADARSLYAYNAAKNAQQSGDITKAIAAYDDVLVLCAKRSAPRSLPFHHTLINRGHALTMIGQTDRAYEDYTAVANDPDAPSVQRFQAFANRANLAAQNNPMDAADDVEAALALGVATPAEAERLKAKHTFLLTSGRK